MATRRRFYYDFHIHTSRHSPCSSIPVEAVIAAARKRGLDGIALTEHGRLWSPAEIDALKAEAGCPSFPVIPGCELTTHSGDRTTGDLLVFGVQEIPTEPLSIDATCREVHGQGGIVIAAHPLVEVLGLGEEIYSAMIDGIEIANHRYYSPQDMRRLAEVCQEQDLASVAASDAHSIGEVGAFCVEVDCLLENDQDLVRAVLERRCRPRLKPPPGRLRQRFRG